MKNIRKGQSLIEVMVALFVLTIGMLGILALLGQSLSVSKTVTNETIATYLAAEGIELSKNIVDHDVYQQRAGVSAGWAQNSEDQAFGAGGNFQLDYTTCDTDDGSAAICDLSTWHFNSGETLGFDPSTNLYYYGAPEATPFVREIKISYPNGAPHFNELIVQSIVTWGTGFNTQSIQLEDHFYNWVPTS